MNGELFAPLLYAVSFLLLALVLLILEFFIVSFGIIAAAATACAIAASYFAFQLGPLTGVSFSAVSVMLGILVARWGIHRVQTSNRLVPKAVISADAGYHHVAAKLGVEVASVGVMVTPARPSGRARFAGGECDVQGHNSQAIELNTPVIVKRIDGPQIIVSPYHEPRGE